jgi:hypothetical protein
MNILERRRVDYVLLCRNATPDRIEALRFRAKTSTRALLLYDPSPWLEDLPVAPDLSERWQLYRVIG